MKVHTMTAPEEVVDVDGILDHWMKDPVFVRTLEHERIRLDRAIYRYCGWGTCEIAVDPVDNTVLWTVGLVGCPCDFYPGWKSKYVEGMPKPRWHAKARGRHGGRIQRKRRIEAEHLKWVKSWRV